MKFVALFMMLVLSAMSAWEWWSAPQRGRVFVNILLSFDRNKQPVLFNVARWMWFSLSVFIVAEFIFLTFAPPQ